MKINKVSNGDYYLERMTSKKVWRDWWIVKNLYNKSKLGYIPMSTINFPKEFIGKKVRFKLEVVK